MLLLYQADFLFRDMSYDDWVKQMKPQMLKLADGRVVALPTLNNYVFKGDINLLNKMLAIGDLKALLDSLKTRTVAMLKVELETFKDFFTSLYFTVHHSPHPLLKFNQR